MVHRATYRRLGTAVLVTFGACFPLSGCCNEQKQTWSLGSYQPSGAIPRFSRGEVDKGDEPADRVLIVMNARGDVLNPHPWKTDPWSLEDWLEIVREKYDMKMRTLGRSGYVEQRGRRWSKMFAHLEIEAAAPWRAVHELLATLRRHGYDRVQFAGRDRSGAVVKIQAPLWRDGALPSDTTRIDIEMRGDAVFYRVDSRAAREVGALGEFLSKLLTGTAPRVVRVRASGSAPFERVAAVVDELQGRGDLRYVFELLDQSGD